MTDDVDQLAESATGCREHSRGLGPLYLPGGREVTATEAAAALVDGELLEIPNAGAGSYRKVIELAGLQFVEVLNWTSSAGDWQFIVRDANRLRVLSQSNRWPRHGFSYSLSDECFETVEEIYNWG